MNIILQAGVIGASLQVILDKFWSFAAGEIGVILGADEEFWKLRRTLERVGAMVRRVEENRTFFSHGSSSAAWKIWLEDVATLSYAAHDLLDEMLMDLAKKDVDADRNQVVRDSVISSLKLTIPRELSAVRKKLDDISNEMDALYRTEFTDGLSYNRYSRASSLVDEGTVVGREKERDEILGLLLKENFSGNKVSVVSIMGMGGIGKTTLAQLVYNDDVLVDAGKFEMKMWVSVSMDFDACRITRSLIESATGERCKLSELNAIQVKLQNLIRGKRFLIVLDDYWSEEFKDWDVLSSPFRVGAQGSVILLTTRSGIVSRIVGTTRLHHVRSLSDEDSWEVFRQRAASNRSLSRELEQIGRQVAGRCGGLPLAAKTLGGILHFKDDPIEWMHVLNSELWDLHTDGNDIFPTLALSYYHLPIHLKKCFAYCALFPKNYDFEVKELVSLWIAEGFVHPSRNMPIEYLEELGTSYFKNLYSRSFFQLLGENVRGQKIYKMHGLIHSMAELISAGTCLHLKDNQPIEDPMFFKNTRHVCLESLYQQPRLLENHLWYDNLRTLKVISESVGNIKLPYDLFLKLKSMRVLDLSRLGLEELPSSVMHMKRLRYLNISGNDFIKLPDSLTALFTLQILILNKCDKLRDLPSNMKEMISLQHLCFDMNQLEEMPPEFGKLINLLTLSAFVVGKTEGSGIGELKNMKSLSGSLCIKNLENVRDMADAKEAMLHMRPFLDRLQLVWNGGDQNHHELILSALQPHENLKELVINNYDGLFLPAWLVGSQCKLSSISLHKCKYDNVLISLAKVKTLKTLTIEDVSSWKEVEQDFSGFPALESLIIKNNSGLISWGAFCGARFPCLLTFHIAACPVLKNLPSLVGSSCLHSLKITKCPKILSLPEDGLPSSLKEFTISDCDILTNRCKVRDGADWAKIRLIPKIVIDSEVIP